MSLSSAQARNFTALALVLLIVGASFLPSLKNNFLMWDDEAHIVNNITLRSLDYDHIHEIFTSTVNKTYIPLTTISFAVEYHYAGYDPFLYHLDNLLLHLLVVILLFIFARQLGLSVFAASVACLFFGVHPMRVESVAWVTERKDVLYAFFYMAALVAYESYLVCFCGIKSGKRWTGSRYLVLTYFLGFLSMLAKPMALSLPLILLLLDWLKGRLLLSRRVFLEKLPVLIFVGALGWITYAANARVPGEGVAQSVLIWPWTFSFYLRQFVFPIFLVPIYRLPKPIALLNPEYLFSLLFFVVTIAAVIRWRRQKWFVFAFLFYFLSIFFLLRFDEVKDINIVADRFMYLPSVGFCLLVGMGFSRLWEGKKTTPAVLALLGGGVLLSVLMVTTYRQNFVWRDSIRLWQHQLRCFPDDAVALNNLGTALSEKEDYKQAFKDCREIGVLKKEGLREGEESVPARESVRKVAAILNLYKKAIASNPNFVKAYCNLGDDYRKLGRISEAVEAYKKALLIDPKEKNAHFGLGDLYRNVGDEARAVYAYEQTLRLHPDDQEVYIRAVEAYNESLKKDPKNVIYQKARKDVLARLTALVSEKPSNSMSLFNLGATLAAAGESERALAVYQRVLAINPRHSGALYNMGNIFKDQGRLQEALDVYQRALDADPGMSDAYVNMGIIYGHEGKKDIEEQYYHKAIRADQSNAKAYFNLAFLDEKSGNLLKSISLYKKSVQLDPENAEGYYNLGNVLAKLGKFEEAKKSYLIAVEKDMKHLNAWINLSIASFRAGDFAEAVRYCDEAILLGYDAPAGYLKSLAPYRK